MDNKVDVGEVSESAVKLKQLEIQKEIELAKLQMQEMERKEIEFATLEIEKRRKSKRNRSKGTNRKGQVGKTRLINKASKSTGAL